MYDKYCGKIMVIYDLKYLTTSKPYVDKMQHALKTCTNEHINNVWKVI